MQRSTTFFIMLRRGKVPQCRGRAVRACVRACERASDGRPRLRAAGRIHVGRVALAHKRRLDHRKPRLHHDDFEAVAQQPRRVGRGPELLAPRVVDRDPLVAPRGEVVRCRPVPMRADGTQGIEELEPVAVHPCVHPRHYTGTSGTGARVLDESQVGDTRVPSTLYSLEKKKKLIP